MFSEPTHIRCTNESTICIKQKNISVQNKNDFSRHNNITYWRTQQNQLWQIEKINKYNHKYLSKSILNKTTWVIQTKIDYIVMYFESREIAETWEVLRLQVSVVLHVSVQRSCDAIVKSERDNYLRISFISTFYKFTWIQL